ncbi:MAG TPA: zinc-ribbon domain-containing protein [Gemmatimonadaceae bacterium]
MNVSCPDCRSIFRVDPAKVPPAGVRARCSVCGGVISIPAPTGQNTPPTGSQRTPPSSSEPAQAPPRPTPPKSDWNTAIFGETSQRTPAAPSSSAPSAPRPAAGPPQQPWSAEVPAAPRSRPESIERTTAAATATPPSPASGLPEFTRAPQAPPHPPFKPTGNAPRPTPAAFNTTPPRPSTPSSAATPAAGDAGARRPLNPFLSKDPNQRAKRLARALVSDIITYHPAKHAEGLRDGTLKQLFREEIKKSFEEYIAQVGQPLAEGTTYFQEALNEVLAAGKKIF